MSCTIALPTRRTIDARVTTELAAFAGLALKMIQDASVLRASEERLNLALHQRAASGHAATAPPRRVMNSRRLIE
jgi:hypothetical protein